MDDAILGMYIHVFLCADLVECVWPVWGFAVCCVVGPLLAFTVWLGSGGDLLCVVGAHHQ